MEIVRLVAQKVLVLAEKILKVLEGEIDYPTFEKQLKKELDALGCALLQSVFAALERQTYQSKERKCFWKVVRRKDKKAILTVFGPLEYQRTYYRHKETNEYAYLVDERVGITPHLRVSSSFKAELAEATVQVSYEQATAQLSRFNPELKVSKQTAAVCVKRFQAQAPLPPVAKRRVKVLYMEADEDHLTLRGKRGGQARLIYIHEGVGDGPRRHLKNVRYFTSVAQDALTFWLEVCDYLSTHYDLEHIQELYLSGDGGNWIRVGADYIPGVTFILDKFHLARSILQATAHAPELKRKIYQGIRSLNKAGVLTQLEKALARAEGKARKERITQTMRYIENNWPGIEAAVKHPHVGCSAEAHVSHVISARMSSRPMAWSLKGAEHMASMRAVRANGESVNEHYLAGMTKKPPLLVELKEEVKKELHRLRNSKVLGKENIGNVPVFQNINNLTRMALRGLNERTVV